MVTITDRLESLDQEHIEAAARFAADSLASQRVAVVRLAPGDMTEYRFVIVAPGVEWAYGEPRYGRYYWVTLCADFGCGYEWGGHAVDGGYAASKWTNAGSSKGTREWTGAVVARFLSAVAQCFAEDAA